MNTLERTSIIAILAAGVAAAPALAQTESAVGERGTIRAEVVQLNGWMTDEIYADGMSVDDFIDDYDVYGAAGEDIGDVEDVIIGADGRVIAVVAEIGGFLDIGDTHVAVPWDQVEMRVGEQAITIPVTEETLDDYDVSSVGFGLAPEADVTGAVAGESIVAGIDDQPLGPRAYRASELIGDYARIRGDGDTWVDYGYVRDVIIRDGEVQAVIVNANAAFGRGYYSYPYYGYGPGYGYGPSYDLPYGEADVGEAERFEYERLGVQ